MASTLPYISREELDELEGELRATKPGWSPDIGVLEVQILLDLIAAFRQGEIAPSPAEPLPGQPLPAAPAQPSTEGLRQMLDLLNENDASRWEIGIRNIVAILHGPRHTFEIKDIVEEVRALAAQPSDERALLRQALDALQSARDGLPEVGVLARVIREALAAIDAHLAEQKGGA